MTTAKTPKKAPTAPAKRPPNARGQGRKPTEQGERRSTSIRLTDEQHQKLARLGGADWVRAQIDKAKEPKA
ncbi:MAG: hypothetical protein ACKOWC_03895 [Limnohabitans sp.]